MKLKNILREEILKERESLAEEDSVIMSKIIENTVMELLETMIPKDKKIVVGLYCPINGEPDLLGLIKKLNCDVAIPKLWGTKLEFIKYDKDAGFEQSEFGTLMQPKNNDITHPDIVVLPGIGFNVGGYRLGFGMGHYDRYFGKIDSARNIIKIGVCFHENLYETLPQEPHDVQSNYIITNKITIAL